MVPQTFLGGPLLLHSALYMLGPLFSTIHWTCEGLWRLDEDVTIIDFSYSCVVCPSAPNNDWDRVSKSFLSILTWLFCGTYCVIIFGYNTVCAACFACFLFS